MTSQIADLGRQNPVPGRHRSMLVIGGGASGVILAAHLLKSLDPNLRVTLIEKRRQFGQGMAYSTAVPGHVLNVNARGMSIYPDDPDHFWRWLVHRNLIRQPDAPFFAPRSVYASYLQDILANLRQQEEATGRLTLMHEETLSVSPASGRVAVELANGATVIGDIAILATGHEESASGAGGHAMRMGVEADGPLDPDARVLVLGAGLSMVDAFLTLEQRGHRGEIVILSRRGLLPSPHRPGKPLKLDVADVPLGTELSYFVRWFRRLIADHTKAGGDWRDVVDGLRPFNQQIWQSWPATAKRRFVEHSKAWWDVHRHRMPPEVHERVTDAMASGRLKLVAGRHISTRPVEGGYRVTIQARRSKETSTIDAARIYDCTGIVRDITKTSNVVLRGLLDSGAARPDPLHLSLDVTKDCALTARTGQVSDRLFAVGPLTRGTFFEIDAVPDIRVQCARLAKLLLR